MHAQYLCYVSGLYYPWSKTVLLGAPTQGCSLLLHIQLAEFFYSVAGQNVSETMAAEVLSPDLRREMELQGQQNYDLQQLMTFTL